MCDRKIYNLSGEKTVVVAIDFQERLMPVMKDEKKLEDKVCRLMRGMEVLGLPIIVTQQYTRGIGDTVEPIREAIGDFEHIEKTSFSAWPEEGFVKAIEDAGADTVIVTGIETHVCVQQTVMDLLENGYKVVIPEDCCSSRSEEDKEYAIARMRDMGAVITTCESVLFELTKGAKAEGFKKISAIVK